MRIFRLIYIFLSIRNTGIFNKLTPSFNPILNTFIRIDDSEKKFRVALEHLGPVFIKLGQLLSTRTDLFERSVTQELNKLTDSCSPVAFKFIKETIQTQLLSKAEKILMTIEKKPLASASLAQVHKFKIGSEDFVIKVQRPGLEELVQRDIDALKIAAKFSSFFLKHYPRVKPLELIEQYENVIFQELDFRIEAANSNKTYENFKSSNYLEIPKIADDFTTKKILVMPFMDGIPVTDISSLTSYKINKKQLSEVGVKIFLKQVFEDNFFHADMHPGNIFAAKTNPQNPHYIAVDYAICGSVTESNQILLAQMISSLVEQDFYTLAQLFIYAEWVDKKTKTEELEKVLRANCEKLLNQPLSKILFGELLLDLFDAMRPFNLFIDDDLLLLVKTLIHIEGMGRQIYPELDFWGIASPFLQDWFKDKYSVKGLVKYLVSKKHILTYMIVKKIEETQDMYSEFYGEKS